MGLAASRHCRNTRQQKQLAPETVLTEDRNAGMPAHRNALISKQHREKLRSVWYVPANMSFIINTEHLVDAVRSALPYCPGTARDTHPGTLVFCSRGITARRQSLTNETVEL
jgi:hypothetical protein